MTALGNSFNDAAVLRENLENVLKENNVLKAELAKYKHYIEIKLDIDNLNIDAVILQNNKSGQLSISKEEILHHPTAKDLTATLAHALSEIHINLIKDEISEKVEALFNNLKSLTNSKSLW